MEKKSGITGSDIFSSRPAKKDAKAAEADAKNEDGVFWILFKDFYQFFYSVTINYTTDHYHITRMPEQIEDEKWGASKLVLPEDHYDEPCFLSLYQMNQKF